MRITSYISYRSNVIIVISLETSSKFFSVLFIFSPTFFHFHPFPTAPSHLLHMNIHFLSSPPCTSQHFLVIVLFLFRPPFSSSLTDMPTHSSSSTILTPHSTWILIVISLLPQYSLPLFFHTFLISLPTCPINPSMHLFY